ncbi:MAG: hypothetical protein O3B31_14190 [Chloroflexi bacterium]|nr:hypothetical protein [Chloroflexota bacterium]MDA1004471.1 hypothetical protein [Chloroflexota bacterium]
MPPQPRGRPRGGGQAITRGEPIGTVAEAGDAANNGLAHTHYALNAPGGSRGWGSGPSLPFTDAFAIEGTALAAVTTPNASSGVRFLSTNVQNRRPTVDAGIDLYVLPGAEVVLTAVGGDADGDPLTYVWAQTGGAVVEITANGTELRFVAGSVDGAQLTFAVTAIDPGVRYASDEVRVFVTTSPPPVSTGVGEILSGALPSQGGFGALLFGGGTTDQLLVAAGCAGNARFWVTANGRFVAHISDAAGFVNAGWNALFPDGISPRAIVIGQCA